MDKIPNFILGLIITGAVVLFIYTIYLLIKPTPTPTKPIPTTLLPGIIPTPTTILPSVTPTPTTILPIPRGIWYSSEGYFNVTYKFKRGIDNALEYTNSTNNITLGSGILTGFVYKSVDRNKDNSAITTNNSVTGTFNKDYTILTWSNGITWVSSLVIPYGVWYSSEGYFNVTYKFKRGTNNTLEYTKSTDNNTLGRGILTGFVYSINDNSSIGTFNNDFTTLTWSNGIIWTHINK